MRARAPGKLVLTGAYAVLEGAPAIVVAVNRYAIADTSEREPNPSIEVRAAGITPPKVDASELFEKSGNKLGLGSSAAVLVASLAAVLGTEDKNALFQRARDAHARAQGGGSGVDVAASTFGGALRYRMGEIPERIDLPVAFAAYFSGASARTSDFVARSKGADMTALREAAIAAAKATDARAFVAAASSTERALEALGNAIDLPVVPPSFARLARLTEKHGAAFLPSGAGGGDVGVWVGEGAPPEDFDRAAVDAGMHRLSVSLDLEGARSI